MKSYSNQKHLLVRKNPKTGFRETVIYTGNLKDKPKGWVVEK